MGIEIERKFLLQNSDWKEFSDNGVQIKQGYLNSNTERTVRVRILDEKGFLTIKSKTVNITRQEFEYEIPLEEALQLLKICEKPLIEKKRFKVLVDNIIWEIDEFKGDNKGLIIAEVELQNEDQQVTLPNWIGKEVSNDDRYYNSSLIQTPFASW